MGMSQTQKHGCAAQTPKKVFYTVRRMECSCAVKQKCLERGSKGMAVFIEQTFAVPFWAAGMHPLKAGGFERGARVV